MKHRVIGMIRAWIKKGIKKIQDKIDVRGLQFTLALSFTFVAVICMTFISFMLQQRFEVETKETKIESTEKIIDQVVINLETYLRNMMSISDAMYYTVIKGTDLATDDLQDEMTLLYEANKDKLVSITCFTKEGEFIGAIPNDTLKKGNDVTSQSWFIAANEEMENLHFSSPHVQNLFDDSSHRYYWVISLSRMVELTYGGGNKRGVLLVDMNYSSIKQQFNKVNSNTSLGYSYLINKEGQIIYHPQHELIHSHLKNENLENAITYEDGRHQEVFEGKERVVIVRTVGYTGWKIVSVIPNDTFKTGRVKNTKFVWMMTVLVFSILILANRFVSAHIASPIKRLEKSVKKIETGDLELDIYEGGPYEVQRLSKSIRSMVDQLQSLMHDIVKEQEEKRKIELDALQSQINPHFLYNTMDTIVWMIESERYQEAIVIVTQLANLFRISLSRGKTIITIKEELMHARSYINIQQIRYKNKFQVTYDIDERICEYLTVKLILQPIIENAIYYGMESMDGDGKIELRAYEEEAYVILEVKDNGLGMKEEVVEQLLVPGNHIRKRGSGVGLINVNKRIQIRFGEAYGLSIASEPDEGTTVSIKLPKLLEIKENLKEGKSS